MAKVRGGAEVKKLAIVGTATNYKETPWADKSYDIWGVSSLITMPGVERLSAIFEMHPRGYWGKPEVLEVLNKYKGPCYMQDHYAEIPTSVRYPIEEVNKAFYMPTMGEHLFVTNTVSFMFALAYVQGYTHIETWGVYMEHETEYSYQRPNCEFFVGFLHGKGVTVDIHGGDVLKAHFLYGYEEEAMLRKLLEDSKELIRAKQQLVSKFEEDKRAIAMQEGAIEYNKLLRKKWGDY